MPEIRARDLLWIAVAVLLSVATAMFAPGVVFAHDPYTTWQRPDGGGSCCSGNADTGDCRQVRARIGDDGLWRAMTPSGEIIIPPSVVLPFSAPDGNAHLCAIGERIFCFAAPVPKS